MRHGMFSVTKSLEAPWRCCARPKCGDAVFDADRGLVIWRR
jgi:hypothetical protein